MTITDASHPTVSEQPWRRELKSFYTPVFMKLGGATLYLGMGENPRSLDNMTISRTVQLGNWITKCVRVGHCCLGELNR